MRVAAGAQQHAVAGLEADRGDIDRHVGARLVDRADHAERHAHAPHLQPVGAGQQILDLPHRVGQRGDRAHVPGHRGDALRCEHHAVEEGAADAVPFGALELGSVDREDRVALRLEGVRDRLQGRGLAVSGGGGEAAARLAHAGGALDGLGLRGSCHAYESIRRRRGRLPGLRRCFQP